MFSRRSCWPALAGLVGILFAAVAVGCGGGSNTTSPPPAPPPILISVTPGQATVSQGATLTFVPVVSGTTNTAVTWRVQEGAAGGAITSGGAYTAPMASGTYHVVATSVADTTKSASANVFVPPVSVFVSPPAVSMGSGESVGLKADVFGCFSPAVNWSITEGAAGGTITQGGSYTAPQTFGTYHAVATSSACGNNNSASATISVAALSIAISPTSDVLGPAGVRHFFPTVLGALNQSVTWTVNEGTPGGTVDPYGLYVAPSSTGTFHITAATVKDPTKSSTAIVNVIASGFRPTGTMRDGRTGATATLLKSGKVLFAGGGACVFYYYYYYSSCLLRSAEVYDPALGAFSQTTATMSTARLYHTASLLSDGRVLVAGGANSAPSAELYDENTGGFTATGAMVASGDSHTATVLQNQHVLIIGGKNTVGSLVASEDYDPSKGTFTVSGDLANARAEHTATLLQNGKVLVTGGAQGRTALASAEIFDPGTAKFTTTGSMNFARSGHAATLLPNGNVLITGGTDGTHPLASAEIYDVATGKFTSVPASMMVGRDSHFAILLTDKVLIAGGTNAGFVAEIFDPATLTFTQTGSMSSERISPGAQRLPDGRVLVAGGSDLNTAEVYK